MGEERGRETAGASEEEDKPLDPGELVSKYPYGRIERATENAIYLIPSVGETAYRPPPSYLLAGFLVVRGARSRESFAYSTVSTL